MMRISAVAAIVLVLAALAFQARGDLSCSNVLDDMRPCMSFLQGDGASPPDACCDGARAVYAAADTTDARQATCECLKTAYRQINAQLAPAQALPVDCGLSLPYVITPNIDCKKIK